MQVIEIIQQHAAKLIAGLAVILSVVANWRVVRAENIVAKAQKKVRRMDMLVEIERKNAATGKLALVTAQKIVLLQQNPELIRDASDEVDRLLNNLSSLQTFIDVEEEQRQIAETEDGEYALHFKALTEIQRLRVHLEADVVKETNVYRELLDKSQKA